MFAMVDDGDYGSNGHYAQNQRVVLYVQTLFVSVVGGGGGGVGSGGFFREIPALTMTLFHFSSESGMFLCYVTFFRHTFLVCVCAWFFQVLSDPQKKERYDSGVDLEDLDNPHAGHGHRHGHG